VSFEVPSQAWLESYIRQTVRQRPAYEVSEDGLILSGATLIKTGSASPESVVAAPVGSLFLRTDGSTSTTLYVKTAGAASNTGWTAK
jgi:hypothetical protein